MIEQKNAIKYIEQLWYTWSVYGIDLLRAGFRIRAATPALRDMRSPRVQYLDRYERYVLPRGVDPTIDPRLAPICLSFLQTGQDNGERILVHKKYTGRDDFGRPGVFFIHLLAGMPEEFTALHAIRLWDSDFWQDSDESLLNPPSTELQPIALPELLTWQQELHPTAEQQTRLEPALAYLLQAYITKKPLKDRNGQIIPQKIYIAAPDTDIAFLIFSLARTLPHLTTALTFSTYEHDITTATTEIVGTCWPSQQGSDSQLTQLLPPAYRQEKLTLNCYMNSFPQPLEGNPLLESLPYAAELAQHAAAYALHGDQEYADFLHEIAREQALTPQQFLQLYHEKVIASNADIVWLTTLLTTTIATPAWWRDEGRNILLSIEERSKRVPRLTSALHRQAQEAIKKAATLAREIATSSPQASILPYKHAAFAALIDIMACIAPPVTEQMDTWLSLLRALHPLETRFVEIYRYWDSHTDLWNLYSYLLTSWRQVLPSSPENLALLCPLLLTSWTRLGAFLDLPLPLAWKELAIRPLVLPNPPFLLTEPIVASLAAYDYARIETLLQQLAQIAQENHSAERLFATLVQAGYSRKMELFFILLEYLPTTVKQPISRLVQMAQLQPHALITHDEQVQFLTRYGPSYLLSNEDDVRCIIALFAHLVKSHVLPVLSSWLDDPRLLVWLEAPSTGEQNLTMLLDNAQLNVQEQAAFLEKYGIRFISSHPLSPTLLRSFRIYTNSQPKTQEVALVIHWLQQLLQWPDKQKSQRRIEEILKLAAFARPQTATIMETSGIALLTRYPGSQTLLSYIPIYIGYISQDADITVFTSHASVMLPSRAEALLDFLRLVPPTVTSETLAIQDWYAIAAFARQPDQIDDIAAPLARRLADTERRLAPHMYTELLMMLAHACILAMNVSNGAQCLLDSLLIMQQALFQTQGKQFYKDIWELLYGIAEAAREGITAHTYQDLLYSECILFALRFRSNFTDPAEQKRFVDGFIGTLLLDIDQQTFESLKSITRTWRSQERDQWDAYVEEHAYTFVSQLSLLDHMEYDWERITAFIALHRALKRKNEKRLRRIIIRHMTTLLCYPGTVANHWQQRLQGITPELKQLHTFYREAYTHQVQQQQQAAASSNPADAARPRYPQLQRKALKRIKKALEIGYIGNIVYVALISTPVLQQGHVELELAHYALIYAVYDFYLACLQAIEHTDEEKEQAIVTSATHLQGFLTWHEQQRVDTARRFVKQKQLATLKGAPALSLIVPKITPPQDTSTTTEQQQHRTIWTRLRSLFSRQ